ncbi:MAG: hypothetical protein ABR548_15150 [Actinomycetota bacterium]
MNKRFLAGIMLGGALLAGLLVPNGATAAGVGTHQFAIRGISEVQNQYQYVPATPFECDRPVDASLCNAAFGIPKPSTLPPTPKSGSNACSIGRNLGPLNPGPVPGHPMVPCAGKLTHNSTACLEFDNPAAGCSFTGGDTWFYGFCGQTYGGAENITFHFGGKDYLITRMGFTRPAAGVWEFTGKMYQSLPLNTSVTGYIRLYLAAVPTVAGYPANNGAGCELGGLQAIDWQGSLTTSDTPLPFITAQPKPGWHWCTGSDGCP